MRVQQEVPDVDVASVDSMVRLLDDALGYGGTRVLMTTVSVTLGVVALLLTMIGVHALASELTARRQQESALRLALGSSPAQAVGVFLREGMGIAVAGGILGAIAAVAAVHVLAPLLSLREPVPIWISH